MGQAFDRDGNVLGEAFGDSKREVFDKLSAQFKDAHEIRIKTLEAQAESGASAEMPRYKCHKEVHALKIAAIDRLGPSNLSAATFTPADAGYAPFPVTAEYMLKHQPQVGGYYVVYEDGYASFSPAAVFENGYTRL